MPLEAEHGAIGSRTSGSSIRLVALARELPAQPPRIMEKYAEKIEAGALSSVEAVAMTRKAIRTLLVIGEIVLSPTPSTRP